jgi:hypothetical protein
MVAVRLICWNRDLAQERQVFLARAGFEVDASPLVTSGLGGQFRDKPPAVVVIDLDRLPSHGREVAVYLRQGKATRRIPIVFAGGVEEKVARIRAELPDAVFAEWKAVGPAVKKALKLTPAEPVKPVAHMARYNGSPLARKLGLKPNATCALLGAPDGFEEQLGEIPEGMEFKPGISRQTSLAIWFVRSRLELEAAADLASLRMPEGGSVWIVHPKQAGRYRTDFNQNDVRAAALAVGLVDYKVCAVDDDWAGLKFARKAKRPTSRSSRTA